MIADIVGCELVFPIEPESAALGAAFQAGAAASGMKVDEYVLQQTIAVSPHSIYPISEHSDSYRRAFALFKKRSTALFQEPSSMYKLYQYGLDECFRVWGYACNLLRKTESASYAFVNHLLAIIKRRREKSEEMSDAEADSMLSALMDVEEFSPDQIKAD
ncbi:hypothetical protein MHU86_8488 [Fragilaria crotonensis]|nr:hypothetical protein MHU86_8488 [Fragilaria crotonensis]